MDQHTTWESLINQAGSGGGAVPASTYAVQVDKAEFTYTNKQPPKKMWKVWFRILTGEYAGRKVINNFVLSPENPNALGFFFEHMAAMGIDKNAFASLPQGEAGDHQLAQWLHGRYAEIDVKVKQGQKGQLNDVDALRPLTNIPQEQTPGVPTPAPAAQPHAQPAAPQPQAQPAPQQPAAQPQPQPVAPAQPQPAPQPAPAPQPQAQPQQPADLPPELQQPVAQQPQPQPQPQPVAQPQPAQAPQQPAF